jgi:hypothetical protein
MFIRHHNITADISMVYYILTNSNRAYVLLCPRTWGGLAILLKYS